MIIDVMNTATKTISASTVIAIVLLIWAVGGLIWTYFKRRKRRNEKVTRARDGPRNAEQYTAEQAGKFLFDLDPVPQDERRKEK